MFCPARFVERATRLGLCGLAIFLCARPTESAPAKASKQRTACANAYKSALQLESDAHLRQAKDAVGACMKAACGSVRPKCAALLARLETDIPSVIPVVTDTSGAPRSNVEVTVDGEVLTSELDGRPLPVDPGLHAFSFATDGGVLATKKVMIVQGERNRPIAIEMGAQEKRGAKRSGATDLPSITPPDKSGDEPTERTEPTPERKRTTRELAPASPTADEPPPKPESSGGSAAPYLFGTLGVVGLGAFGAFTYWGKKDNELLAACSPNCSPSSVDHIRKLYLAADISLGVGVVALGTATILALSSGGSSKEKPAEAAYVVDVHPTPSGAFASLSGAF
jgi:hypothetical protein